MPPLRGWPACRWVTLISWRLLPDSGVHSLEENKRSGYIEAIRGRPMGAKTEREPPQMREVRRRSTPTPLDATVSRGLPPDLLDTGVRRLGFLGLVVALMGPAVYLIERITQPERVGNAGVPFQFLVALILFIAGAAMCVLAWSRVMRRELLLDLGLVFQVVVAFLISLTENATSWPAGQLVRGISWNCLWISMYVVAIPGTYGKSVLAAITAACMAPFGLLVASVVNQYPLPDPRQLLLLQLPPFVAAAWAIPAARYLYRLGAQVSRARAMGSYELIELIGQGGMGQVWRAQHRMLARVSAIKLIRPEVLAAAGNESIQILLRRFEREARATATLRSPHTVALYDYGVSEDGSFYYAMEYLEGLDLETLVQRFGPLPAARVRHFLLQAAHSLSEAHENGLVHRDIKPRNMFACRLGTEYDFVKVLDFGLVKLKSAEGSKTDLTAQGVTTGTPAYMAPEIAMGSASIDGRADLYSLGCSAYWLLTGQVVFEAPTAMAVVLAHLQTPPVPPSQRTELEVPASLESVVMQCMEKDPARRPQSALELADQLESCDGIEPWTRKEAGHWWRTHLPQGGSVRTASAAQPGDNLP